MNAKTIIAKAGLVLKQASPEILVGFGILSGVAAIFTACSKMKETEPVKEEFQEELETIAEEEEKGTKEYFVASFKAVSKTSWRYLKIFWLPILLELLSIGAIWYSHGMMIKRNEALASTAVMLTQQLDKYRSRVRDKVGEEAENDLFYGMANKKVGEITTIGEDGKEKKVKVMEKVFTDGACGPFDRIFDKSNHNYANNPGTNMVTLKCTRDHLQQLMEARASMHNNGWLTINEVYEAIGFDPVEDGFSWGWIWSPKDPEYTGTVVDFGINEFSNQAVRDFINGIEPAIPLHFNCKPLNIKQLKLMKI